MSETDYTWGQLYDAIRRPEEVRIKVKYFDNPSHDTKELDKLNKGDWIDLYTWEDVCIRVGESMLVPLGVAMKLPVGYEAILAPRSSTFKKYGIIQTNSIGVIDSSYCGDNDMWRFPVYALKDTNIPAGTRLCQFRIQKNQPVIIFDRVDHLSDTDRGGFGSTGV